MALNTSPTDGILCTCCFQQFRGERPWRQSHPEWDGMPLPISLLQPTEWLTAPKGAGDLDPSKSGWRQAREDAFTFKRERDPDEHPDGLEFDRPYSTEWYTLLIKAERSANVWRRVYRSGRPEKNGTQSRFTREDLVQEAFQKVMRAAPIWIDLDPTDPSRWKEWNGRHGCPSSQWAYLKGALETVAIDAIRKETMWDGPPEEHPEEKVSYTPEEAVALLRGRGISVRGSGGGASGLGDPTNDEGMDDVSSQPVNISPSAEDQALAHMSVPQVRYVSLVWTPTMRKLDEYARALETHWVQCQHCGEPFFRVENSRKYCPSTDCSTQAANRRRREARASA